MSFLYRGYIFGKRMGYRFKLKKSLNPFTVLRRELFENLISNTFERAYERVAPLKCTAYVTKEPLPFERRFEGKKVELSVGDKWADDTFDCAWFHITGDIPKELLSTDKADVFNDKHVFLINCGGEGLVVDKDGIEKQGITCYASQFSIELGAPEKKVVIDRGLSSGGKAEFFIDCGANDLFGNMKRESRVAELSVARVNGNLRALAYDLQVLMSVYDFNPDGGFGKEIYKKLTSMSGRIKKADNDAAAELRKELKPLLDTRNTGSDVFQFSALGHAHLDLAWLWPIRETIRKGARTFANQFLSIERYPGYVFGASQAQLYQWMKDEYPRLYSRAKELFTTPNWEIQGATWVEPDSNLISGESLVRQFYYGKKFFKEEFDTDMNVFWVPDSFGYSACIPQVMQLAGVPYFLTQKMSWNTVNKFPHHTFRWEGLDGSAVYAHMLPESTYNAPVRADYLKFGERNYTERKMSNRALSLFGIGDGGGGPGFEHIERAVRLEDLKDVPKYKMEKGMDALTKIFDEVTELPEYKGELYLERHRGTYTTQAKNKKYNRKCEFALKNYEMLAAYSSEKGVPVPIDRAEIDEIWKEVLLYQFHDILPGSSINRVYEESVPRYEAMLERLAGGTKDLLSRLVPARSVVNFNSYNYDKAVKAYGKWHRLKVPALGCAAVTDETELKKFFAKADKNSIENDKAKVVFEKGVVVSFTDKASGREVVAPGRKMGVLSSYKDKGDCWDIRPYSYQKTKKDAVLESFKTGTDGAEAFAVATYTLGESKIEQRFSLTDGSNMLSGLLNIDCKQEKSMMRIAFPVNIFTKESAFNIQFGHIFRKTTEDDKVEKAQFEVSGQKFVDMSDGDKCGVSLLNDCKYGFRCKGNVIDMNLIRSPRGGPGKNVDQGKHVIKYALLPHEGALGEATYKEAYLLNNPFMLTDETGGAVSESAKEGQGINIFKCNTEDIVVEAIKHADDGDGFVVRAYNSSASTVTADLGFSGYTARFLTDIFETPMQDIEDEKITFRGFELKNIIFTKIS